MIMIEVTFNIHWDAEAEMYWASSDDVDGLVVEGKTEDEVRADILGLLPDFIDQINPKKPKRNIAKATKPGRLRIHTNTHRQDDMLISA